MNDVLYKRIYEEMKNRIKTGYYDEDGKIPFEREIAEEFDASRDSVRKALSLLKNEQYIQSVKGKGTFIRESNLSYPLNRLASFTEMVEINGNTPSSIIISTEEIQLDDDLIKRFPGYSLQTIYKIERIRLSDDEIMCYEITFISKETCPDLLSHLDNKTSLYNLYENYYNIELGIGNVELKAILSNTNLSDKLKISVTDPILQMNANVFTVNNEPLYYVIAYYNAEKYRFNLNLISR